jgi:hypothetical protein
LETRFSGALGLFLVLVFRQLAKFLFGRTGQYDLPPVLADVQAVVGDCDQAASQTEEGSDLDDAAGPCEGGLQSAQGCFVARRRLDNVAGRRT